jgi:hypothetical protein
MVAEKVQPWRTSPLLEMQQTAALNKAVVFTKATVKSIRQ